MYIQLMHRHHGIHEPIKHIEIPCEFSDVYRGDNNINEELLLNHIPEGWLSVEPSRILLAVADKYGSTGQIDLYRFRPWAKYFDAYCLELYKEPLDWWDD